MEGGWHARLRRRDAVFKELSSLLGMPQVRRIRGSCHDVCEVGHGATCDGSQDKGRQLAAPIVRLAVDIAGLGYDRAMASDAGMRSRHLQRGIVLEYVTIAWNVIEGIVAVASGSVAGSVALICFGIDSFIETSSGAVLLWRLQAENRGQDAEKVERKALMGMGICFLLLAAYVAVDAVKTLWERQRPERSAIGIGIAVLSIVVMPWLAHLKRKAAGNLKSASLQADSRQSSLCAYLSLIVVLGLLLNALLGWWWADPVAGLAMVPIIAKEGRDALRGKPCADCH